MIKFGTVLNTCGDGHWSNVAKQIQCKYIDIGYCNKEETFAELRVYFDTASWDVAKDGLIYTDSKFLKELQQALKKATLYGDNVSYSEQGMQGEDYVSCDVGKAFIDSLKEIAPEVFED